MTQIEPQFSREVGRARLPKKPTLNAGSCHTWPISALCRKSEHFVRWSTHIGPHWGADPIKARGTSQITPNSNNVTRDSAAWRSGREGEKSWKIEASYNFKRPQNPALSSSEQTPMKKKSGLKTVRLMSTRPTGTCKPVGSAKLWTPRYAPNGFIFFPVKISKSEWLTTMKIGPKWKQTDIKIP